MIPWLVLVAGVLALVVWLLFFGPLQRLGAALLDAWDAWWGS